MILFTIYRKIVGLLAVPITLSYFFKKEVGGDYGLKFLNHSFDFVMQDHTLSRWHFQRPGFVRLRKVVHIAPVCGNRFCRRFLFQKLIDCGVFSGAVWPKRIQIIPLLPDTNAKLNGFNCPGLANQALQNVQLGGGFE